MVLLADTWRSVNVLWTGNNMTGICELILRAPDGREQRGLAIIPDEEWCQDYYAKARKRGLEIEMRELNDN